MKNIKKISINKVIITVFMIGFISGLLFFYLKTDADYSYYIKDFCVKAKTYNQSLIIHNASLVVLIYVLSLTIIGIVLIYLLVFIESFSIGFTTGLFVFYLKAKGFIFYTLFLFECKLLNMLLLFYFVNASTGFTIKCLDSLRSKNDKYFCKYFSNHFYRFLIILASIIINSLIIKYLMHNITINLINIIT